MTKNRFLRKATGDDQQATFAGVRLLMERIALEGNGVIVVPMLRSITMLENALPGLGLNQLPKLRTMRLQGENTISLCGDTTLKNYSRDSVYLALWSTPSTVAAIELLPHCQSIIWVTWNPDDAREWKKLHKPQIF